MKNCTKYITILQGKDMFWNLEIESRQLPETNSMVRMWLYQETLRENSFETY
ncbi:MAG: hypothetical protein R6V04_04450 [bacterium]